MFELCRYRVANFTSCSEIMSGSETVAKIHIEFQWGSKLQGTSSEALILSRALSGQQICVVLQSWSATFTHNFDAQFGAILRTWRCVVGAAKFYHGLKNTIFYHIFSIISKRRPVPPYRDYIFLKIPLLPKCYKKMVQNKRTVFIFQCKKG